MRNSATSPRALTPRQTRALRPRTPRPSATATANVIVEVERGPRGRRQSATVLLVGAECPYTCVYCDLWRGTLETATAPGALVRQLDRALATLAPDIDSIKLYNASNFFEPRAVPEQDDPALVDRLRRFGVVTVECHPALVSSERGRRRLERWVADLDGRLEVAMGLETTHPTAMPRLGKGLDLGTWRTAADVLRTAGADLRAFVLIGAPYVPVDEVEASVAATVGEALSSGAAVVSLIPVRGGNGAMEKLAAEGHWTAPDLALVERCYHRGLELEKDGTAVLIDGWDLEALARSACDDCGPERSRRLVRMSLSGELEPDARCPRCRHEDP